MLSSSTFDPAAAVAAQIAFSGGADGAKDGPSARIGYDLTLLQQEYSLANVAAAAVPNATAGASDEASSFTPSNPDLQIVGNRVVIDVAPRGDIQTLGPQLTALGMEITGSTDYVIEGMAPIDSLSQIAALDDVRFATPAYAPMSAAGSVTTQGDVAMHSNLVRSLSGFDGTGVTVGVLSDSFNSKGGYSSDISTGDLPAGVNVIQDSSGTDEGRAMLQIVHDVAPGAGLSFATANGGQVNFANNIKALANAGAKVIVDDVSYFAEPFFQDGVIAQAVDQVKAQGVAYFSAAANDARSSYQSAFRSGDTFTNRFFSSVAGAPQFFGGTAQNFASSGAVQDSQSITLAKNASITIGFQWAQPFFSVSGGSGSASDLDIYLLNSANQVVAGSADNNTGGDPSEFFSFKNTASTAQTYKLMIVKFSGPSPSQVKYVDFLNGAGGVTVNTFDTQSSTIVGHSNANGAESVGAAWYQQTPAFGVSPPVLEPYSSAGSTPILYSTTGSLLATPDPRTNKPGLVAPDGGSTSVSGFSQFFGTSAAAPHAAAVAALMLQYKPSATPSQIFAAMEGTAIDMGTPGFDNDTGHGLLQADRAIAKLTTTPPRLVSVTQVATPRNSGVSSLNLVFSEPVTGLTLSNLRLTRDGGSNLLPGSATLSTSDKMTWVLGNLSSLTGAQGNYRLELIDSHAITNLVGVPVVGNLDFAVASASNKVGVVRSNADGSFSADPALDSVVGTPSAIASGDVNGDGIADLVALVDGASKVAVYVGQGGGLFAAPVAYAVGSSPVTVKVADLTGDGRDEIVTANLSNSITVLKNDGTGAFPANLRTDYTTPDRAKDVVIGDFDRDGSNDLAVSVENTGVIVFYNAGFNGVFSNSANNVTYAASADRGLAMGDVDGDGWLDIVAAGSAAHTLSVLYGGPNRTFTAIVNSLGGDSPLAVAVGDLNADGHSDLIYVDNSNSKLVTLMNDASGRSFTVGQTIGPLSQKPNDVEVGDFNRDGKADVIVATDDDLQQSTAFIYTNSGSALQTPPILVATGTTGPSKGVVVGELDGLTLLSTFSVDVTGPTVTDVVDVTPDPRTTSVPTVDVVFSEPIDLSTFTFQDMTLTRDGSAVALSSAVTTSFVSGTTYRISGLDGFTTASGSYVLSINASGINDAVGNAGTGSASDTWTDQPNNPTPVPAVLDNGGAGYAETGTWFNNGSLGGYGGNLVRYAAPGDGSTTATWTVSGLPPASYDVQVTWLAHPNRASNAKYKVYDGNTLLATITVDQRSAPVGPTDGGATFQSLGLFAVSSGPLRVVLGNNADGYIIADAIRVATPAVVDNGGAGYSETGTWSDNGTAGGYGGNLTRVAVPGDGSSTATWTMTGLAPASYDVQVTWLPQASAASNAKYKVYDGNNLLATVTVDQRNAPVGTAFGGVTFQSLGLFAVSSGPLRVVLGNDADGTVIADAMRVATPAPTTVVPTVVDNSGAGYAETGTWFNNGSLGGYGGNLVRYAAPGDGSTTATWTVSGLAPASYDVQVTWLSHPNRASNAKYKIYDGNTLLATVTLDQRNAPVGTTDGGAMFQSLGSFAISSGVLRVVLGNDADGYIIADALRVAAPPG